MSTLSNNTANKPSNPKSSIIEAVWPAPNHIIAGVTTRNGGHSLAPFTSWNLAEHVGDNIDDVTSNRAQLSQKTRPIDAKQPANFIWLNQVHGNEVIELDGMQKPDTQADAATTSLANTSCNVLTADCLPILLCDKSGRRVAAIHAGWRGLAQGVIENTVEQFRKNGAFDNEIYAWLGPAIGPDHFEVGLDVKEQFTDPEKIHATNRHIDDTDLYEAAFTLIPCQTEPEPEPEPKPSTEHYLADIYQLATIKLNRAAVHHIYGGGFCTVCEQDRFFSYRAAQRPDCNAQSENSLGSGVTGRMASFIFISSP